MPSDSLPSIARHDPRPMLGVVVVESLVDVIVSGAIAPGGLLPPEGALIDRFGVSRTVIRESIKLIEEKGLVQVARGRGTTVQPTRSWNILDPVVLRTMIKHDVSLGVLDELSVVRAQLESVMAADTASQRTDAQLGVLTAHMQQMRDTVSDEDAFRAADVAFHEHVMGCSGNRLAENIALILFERARESHRYQGVDSDEHFRRTVIEHEAIHAAIVAQDRIGAGEAMRGHIEDSWQRRRIPTARPSGR